MGKEITPEQQKRIDEFNKRLPKAVVENLNRNVRLEALTKQQDNPTEPPKKR